MKPLRRALDVLTIGAFTIALASSRIDEIVRGDHQRGPNPEGRTAAPHPGLPTTFVELGQFSNRFEPYYSDTFGLRDVLLRWRTMLDYFVLGVTPSNELVLGRDGWIFFTGEWTFENARGIRALSASELAGWRAALTNRRDVLARAGCAYLYVSCPNKETIYRERLPSVYAPLGPTRLEQLVDYLADDPSIGFLDLRPALLAEKARDSGPDTLYPAHGTHWMGRAVFAAYRAITAPLASRFPAMNRYDASECRLESELTTDDSWSPKMYLGERLMHHVVNASPSAGPRYVNRGSKAEPDSWRTVDAVGDLDGPRAIVFCDSFFENVRPFLSDSFSEVWYVQGNDLTEKEIADFRPDVMIDLLVERCLQHAPPPHLTELPPPRGDASAARASFVRLFALDWKAAHGGLLATADARAELVGSGADTCVALTTPTNGDRVRLPTIVVPEAHRVSVRVSGSCAREELLDLYWKSRDEPDFKISWRASIPLIRSLRTHTVAVTLPPGPVDVMLRARDSGSTAVVCQFDVFAEAR